MSPRVEELRIDVRRRYRRTVFGMVFLGFATVVLGAAVGWAIATNFSQDEQLQTYSACAERPNSAECIKGHANSVALTTHAEACFILAQAGRRCGPRPLPEAGAYHQNLLLSTGLDADEISYDAIPPAGSAPDRPASSVPPSSEPVSPAVPRPPRTPNPPAPTPPSKPTETSPEPAPPAQPAKQAPAVDAPDQLGLCVNALGIPVIC